MANLRKSWRCAMYTFTANNLRPITLSAIFLVCMLMGDKLATLKTFMAGRENINVWGLCTFLMCDSECILIMGIALLLVMGNAPFVTESQQSILIRTGQPNWLTGQILYMSLTTLTAMLGMVIFVCLYFAPHLSFDNQWGRVINTLTTLEPELDYAINLEFSPRLIDVFNPIPAFFIAMGLRFLCYVLCLHMMFFINLIVKARPGSIIALAILLMDYIAVMCFGFSDYIYSVSTLARLDVLVMAPRPYTPNVAPSIALLLGWLTIATAGCIIAGRRADIGKMAM